MASMNSQPLYCDPELRWRAAIGPSMLCKHCIQLDSWLRQFLRSPGFLSIWRLAAQRDLSLSEKKPKTALIKSCLGYWDVKVGRSGDGKLAFEEGWEEFVKCNGLKEEDVVVFEHKGDMVFNVVAYDSGECEKSIHLLPVAANRMATSAKARSNKHHRGSKGKGLLKTTKWLTSRKLFKIKMAKTHGCVSKGYVTIPARFARENGLHSISKLILNDPRGRLWPVSLGRWGSRLKAVDHRLAIKTKGWCKFLHPTVSRKVMSAYSSSNGSPGRFQQLSRTSR